MLGGIIRLGIGDGMGSEIRTGSGKEGKRIYQHGRAFLGVGNGYG
jgi:hypothetical protein